MREILFRGKSAKDGKWFTGQLLHFKSPVSEKELNIIVEGCEFDDFNEWLNIGRRAKVVPETIGQYTGLTDKNGKRIFEGDIVKAYNEHISEVTFSFGSFCCYRQCDDTHNMLWCVRDILTVIGNIHDNPELLKGDNK